MTEDNGLTKEFAERPLNPKVVPECPDCKVLCKRTIFYPKSDDPEESVWIEVFHCPLCQKSLGSRKHVLRSSLRVI